MPNTVSRNDATNTCLRHVVFAEGCSTNKRCAEDALYERTCVVAIHEYKKKNGRLPASLDGLTPEFLPDAPTDPFSGRAFVYKVRDNGKSFLLYSVGSDQVDGGGGHVESMLESGDHVFWPPPIPARIED